MKLNVGFIGCGALGSSIVTGLAKAPGFQGRLVLSDPFNKANVDKLYALYPEKVVPAESHEDLLKQAEIIFPAVLPKLLQDIMSDLTFTERHKVIHVAAGIDLAEGRKYYGNAGKVLRAVPLPFASRRMGPMVLFGDDEDCRKLFSLFGTLMNVSTEKELEILAVHTALMVPYYAVINEVVKWSMEKGMPLEKARDYICSMNSALSSLMVEDDVRDIEAYMVGKATPGGTNEEAHRILSESEAYSPWHTAMESVGKRYGL
ncbi:MAG: NAD(P)-binding domain-containing protein [Synergistaceae bacterium]|nr:NAD(P)-binding domain-containing protein [Synergistaceae bacterium]